MTETLNERPDIEELHEAVMEIIDDYIDFEYSFTDSGRDFSCCEMDGNADEGDDLETLTMWEGEGLFEVIIERGYKQRGMQGEEYIYDMNYQGTSIEGDYDAYVKWLKKEWSGVYEEAIEVLDND
jgi:hypothetical protein